MDAVDFLVALPKAALRPFYVLAGDEEFLKHQVRTELSARLLEGTDPSFALAAYPGDTAQWPAVRAELHTLPFLAPRRVVIIEQADGFVTEHRPALEAYLAKPAPGVLILDVRTWAATTKLAKATPDAATVLCKAPKPAQLPAWCSQRAESAYAKKMPLAAAQLLVRLTEPSLALLEQELAKLAAYVGDAQTISAADVDRVVSRSREAQTFTIFDAIGRGQAAEALTILQKLFADGADPIRLLGAFSWQLTRLAKAHRLMTHGLSASQALTEVGAHSFYQASWEQQLRHLGRSRLEKLYDWLVEIDLGMKGNSTLPMTEQLERLVVKLVQPSTRA
jgi:DNA polymerase-3 subunit delta